MRADRLRGLAGLALARLAGRLGLWRRYERWLDPHIQGWLARRPGTFLDVGVHLGQTLLKVKRLSPATPYVGCEPNPAALFHALELVRTRRLEGCRLLGVGLGAAPSLAELASRDADTDSAASLVDGFREASFYAVRRHVPVFDGDTVIARLGAAPVSMIKIDVEGGELEVLEGLRGTLQRDRPAVLCELLPVYDPATRLGAFRKARQDRLEELMRSLDYRFHRIGRDAGLSPLERLEVHGDLARCEHLFVPGEEQVAWAVSR